MTMIGKTAMDGIGDLLASGPAKAIGWRSGSERHHCRQALQSIRRPSPTAEPAIWVMDRVVAMLDCLQEWQERARRRRALSRMDEHMCKDIGVSSADLWREVEKPFWRR